jgi:hypothetical protein
MDLWQRLCNCEHSCDDCECCCVLHSDLMINLGNFALIFFEMYSGHSYVTADFFLKPQTGGRAATGSGNFLTLDLKLLFECVVN